MPQTTPSTAATNLLVLGGGFAGVWCAREAAKRLPRTASVTLISTENYFVFQPLLPEVVGASLEPGHVISPLRQLVGRARVVRGEITGIAPGDHTVTVRVPDVEQPLQFQGQHTVLALGSIVDVSRIPGMAEHAFLMKNLADALRLRHAIIDRLECAVLVSDPARRAALLSFVVVGGGFSGVETAAEVLDLVRHAQRYYPTLRHESIRVVCVHSGEVLLPELDARLGRFAREALCKRGLEVRMGVRVRAVSGEAVHLDDGSVLAARTVVCTVGNARHPVLAELDLPTERGRIVTDECLRVPGRERLWAVGDCAYSPDGHGGIAPPTAQFALRQGKAAADNIVRVLRGVEPRAFAYKAQGQLATLGHRNAVAFVAGRCVSGFLAWWLWRTVYLMKLPRLHRKLQVMVDWTLNLVFPRDLNFLDVRSSLTLRRLHLEVGEELFRQGDPATGFYVIESGQMELCRYDRDGHIETCETLEPGEHFGEGSMLHGRVRRATVRAQTPATVLAIGAGVFDELMEHWTVLRNALDNTSRRFAVRADILPRGVPDEVLARTCHELMTAPVTTLPADATLERALQLFTDKPYGCLPLVDAGGRLVGIATRTDLYRAMHRDLDLGASVASIASARLHTVAPTDSVALAVERLRRRGIKHLPVVDGENRVVGMISFRDVLRHALSAEPGQAPSATAS